MTIQEYFEITNAIAAKNGEVAELKALLSDSRKEIDLDEVAKLKAKCDSSFGSKKDRRECFVFLFVLTYSVTLDSKIPHSIRFLLGLILKVDGASVSRDWRNAKQRMKEDKVFLDKANEIFKGI